MLLDRTLRCGQTIRPWRVTNACTCSERHEDLSHICFLAAIIRRRKKRKDWEPSSKPGKRRISRPEVHSPHAPHTPHTRNFRFQSILLVSRTNAFLSLSVLVSLLRGHFKQIQASVKKIKRLWPSHTLKSVSEAHFAQTKRSIGDTLTTEFMAFEKMCQLTTQLRGYSTSRIDFWCI